MRFNDTVENADRVHGAHLEINVKLPDNLCTRRTIDGHGFDGQARAIEGELTVGKEGTDCL